MNVITARRPILIGELPHFVHRPYLVVTMADLWPRFEAELSGDGTTGQVTLAETAPGEFGTSVQATIPGAYRFLIGGAGLSSRQHGAAERVRNKL